MACPPPPHTHPTHHHHPPQIDRVLLPGALEGRHWKEIPRATPGSENSYAYMDT